jgi:hypothetical protein
MARGSDQAKTGADTANSFAKSSINNSNALYSSLAPQLQSAAAHPAGYDAQDLASMETGAQQSAGGAEAAAVGQGALLGARTRNKGAAAAAIPEASRAAGQQLSQNTLGIRAANAGLKESQKQHALSGLESLTGIESGASNGALGNVAGNVNADVNAQNASWNWAKYILDPAMQAAGQAAGGYLSK